MMKGIVLAGGKSRRFGKDKALAFVEGVPMIQRAINLLRELHLDPRVIINATQDYSFLKCRIERDLIPNEGPLGGLYTACRIFKGMSLVVLSCDMPALTPVVLQNLMQSHQKVNQVTVYMRNETQNNHYLEFTRQVFSAQLPKKLPGESCRCRGFFVVLKK